MISEIFLPSSINISERENKVRSDFSYEIYWEKVSIICNIVSDGVC